MTLLTASDVATALKVSRKTVLRLVARGQLRAIRLNARVVRFRPADLERCYKRHLAA